MINFLLTGNERLQFQYILPYQGSRKTLDMVEKILNKVKISDANDMEVEKEFKFEDTEIEFMKQMIDLLDKQQQLRFESLSLIKKIMNIKG